MYNNYIHEKMPTENSVVPLKHAGQCVFIYRQLNTLPLLHNNTDANKKSEDEVNCPSFFFSDKDKTNILKIKVKNENIHVSLITQKFILAIPTNMSNDTNDYFASYWFSLDAQNRKLYAGIGEPRLETANYFYLFENHDYKKILESFTYLYYDKKIEYVKLLKDPVTNNIPLLVKNTDDLTMEDIAKNKYMPKANLSSVSQKMYECISGKKFVLNTPDFPEFTDAIEHSISTPGCWCNTTLKNKSTEFNKDKPNLKETYLRITLGENNGESPGIPYVMEIWPIGHYSPIHSHADAEAIIRVLHGSIHVKLYPYLPQDKNVIVKPFAYADFNENDITWISSSLNQTHQLVNLQTSANTCITIQCYMYDKKNKEHYDYFDYIDEKGHVLPYEPDSDMNFIAFKELMKNEWMAKTKSGR